MTERTDCEWMNLLTVTATEIRAAKPDADYLIILCEAVRRMIDIETARG
jgi:hypothetical protein